MVIKNSTSLLVSQSSQQPLEDDEEHLIQAIKCENKILISSLLLLFCYIVGMVINLILLFGDQQSKYNKL
ncbi:MAG: hypothetical protein ACRYE7_01860 [Janthinobacterium lividum]